MWRRRCFFGGAEVGFVSMAGTSTVTTTTIYGNDFALICCLRWIGNGHGE